MAARGTPIEGWWAWWPFHGAQYARRFATDADAHEYLPNVKSKEGVPHPLGDKLVMRVAWDHENNRWSNDKPIRTTQQEVAQQWAEQARVREAELQRTERESSTRTPESPQTSFPVTLSGSLTMDGSWPTPTS